MGYQNGQRECGSIPTWTKHATSKLQPRFGRRASHLRWIFIAICLLTSVYLLQSTPSPLPSLSRHKSSSNIRVLQPSPDLSPIQSGKKKKDPEKWLHEHSNMNHFETGKEWFNNRPRAALISLVRNEELEGILQSMRQLEWHWNKRYRYPWMFFSEKPFTEEFKVIFTLTQHTVAFVYSHLPP